MPQHVPKAILRDTFILWVMLRAPRTLGDAYRMLRARTKSISLNEYIGRIDFLASRRLVDLDFTLSLQFPRVNITDEVPDGFLAILAKVKVVHKYVHTP